MPYDRISELPDATLSELPKRAKQIYKEAYNSAEGRYEDPNWRIGDESQEEAAHRVAWSAVKEKYEKKGDRWVRKEEQEE